MYLCVRAINHASFYDLSIRFDNWSDSVVFISFYLITFVYTVIAFNKWSGRKRVLSNTWTVLWLVVQELCTLLEHSCCCGSCCPMFSLLSIVWKTIYFLLMSFFCWLLHCLIFVHLRVLITPFGIFKGFVWQS